MVTQVGTIQYKYREDFSSTEAPAGWEMVVGSGMAVDHAGLPSGLRVTMGTDINSTTRLRLTNAQMITPARAMFLAHGVAMLSQRIVNQEVELRLASADGLDYVSWLFDGTVATTAKIRSANRGVAAADVAVTIPDTSTGSPIFELEAFIDEVYWHSRTADSTSSRVQSGVRNRRVPDPSIPLFVEIVLRNLGTAPASSTTFTLDAITIQDITEITAEITGGRGGGADSQSIRVTGNVTVNTGIFRPQSVQVASDPVTQTALTASGSFSQTPLDTGTDATVRPTRHRPTVMLASTSLVPGTLILEESVDNTTFRETWRVSVPIDGLYHTFDVPNHYRYYRWRIVNNVATAMTTTWVSNMTVRAEGPTDIDKTITYPFVNGAMTAAEVRSFVLDLGANHMWDVVRFSGVSDQALTVFVDESHDNVNWYTIGTGTAVAAAAGARAEQTVASRYIRFRFVMGATTSTATRFSATLVSL